MGKVERRETRGEEYYEATERIIIDNVLVARPGTRLTRAEAQRYGLLASDDSDGITAQAKTDAILADPDTMDAIAQAQAETPDPPAPDDPPQRPMVEHRFEPSRGGERCWRCDLTRDEGEHFGLDPDAKSSPTPEASDETAAQAEDPDPSAPEPTPDPSAPESEEVAGNTTSGDPTPPPPDPPAPEASDETAAKPAKKVAKKAAPRAPRS